MPPPPRKKLLLVTPDPRFFDLPENSFQSRGCDVFTAVDAAEAIAFLGEHSVDLVISRGEPAGATLEALHGAMRGDSKLIVVPEPGQDMAALRRLQRVHTLDAPTDGKSDGKGLLRLSAKILEVPERKYISILVQVRLTKPKPTTIFGKSRDLSDGGLLIETSQQLTIYDQVIVSFLIPGADRMVQTDALVVREVPKPDGGRRYGLRFLSLSDEDRTIITEFISGKGDSAR